MQDKKFSVSINAKFNPDNGELQAEVHGNNVDICCLMGILAAQIVRSHARVSGCTELEAFEQTIGSIAFVAKNAPNNDVTIDLSHKLKED